jgi:hypothetical protein
LETGQSCAHAYSSAVYQQPIPLVSAALHEQKIRIFFEPSPKICTNSYVELKGYVEGKVPYVPARIEISHAVLPLAEKLSLEINGVRRLKTYF